MIPDYRSLERDPDQRHQHPVEQPRRSAPVPFVLVIAIVVLAAVLLLATGTTSGDRGGDVPAVPSTTTPSTLTPGGVVPTP